VIGAAAWRGPLESIFGAALAAVDSGTLVRRAIDGQGEGLRIAGASLEAGARLSVLAVGKAAAAMAAAFEERVADRLRAGLVVIPDGHGVPLARMVLRESAHPVPDERSEAAGREALAWVAAVPEEDVLIVLLSGGASSLVTTPLPGLELDDLAATTAALLAGGADIEAMNAVRKHTNALAGGRLALAARARRIQVLAISDVPGDRIDVIGSGPCAPDPSRYADALAAIARFDCARRTPERILTHLEAGARGEREETPKPWDPRLAHVATHLLGTNAMALDAACQRAAGEGLIPVRGGSVLRGEARRVGAQIAALADALSPGAPRCLVFGGETSVTVRGGGRGGRSQELALAAAIALEGRKRVTLLAAGSDGRDGPTDAAGAVVDGRTIARARSKGLDARAALAENDSYSFFSVEGGLIRTGPTRTNVMDLVLLQVG
jgi:glycerate-2-kinase